MNSLGTARGTLLGPNRTAAARDAGGIGARQRSDDDDAVPGGAVPRRGHPRRPFAVPMTEMAGAMIEVLLVTRTETRAADNFGAQYLAQRNQQGSGTTDEHVRPAPAPSAIPAQQAGCRTATAASIARPARLSSRRDLSSRSERSEVEYRSGDDRPAQHAEAPLALARLRRVRLRPTPRTTRCACAAARGRHVRSGADTRESKLAPYLDAWQRRSSSSARSTSRRARAAAPAIRCWKSRSAATAVSAR